MAAYKDLEQQYGQAMEEHGFLPDPENRRYGSMGLCWRHTSQQGGGFFWTYGQQDLYTIKIHDFFFHEDQLLEFHWPESLSVTWYESICIFRSNKNRYCNIFCFKRIISNK